MSWTTIYFIASWTVSLGMIPIIVRRRQPTEAMAWLLLIFLSSWVGLIAYLLVGEYGLPRRRIRKWAKAELTLPREQWPKAEGMLSDLAEPFHSVARLVENLTGMPPVGGNRVEILHDTEDVIDRLIGDLRSARHHVHLLVYIFEDDDTGRRVTEALCQAAARGVQCRVLVDSVGSYRLFPTLSQQMQNAGVEVLAALPVNPFRRKLARIDLRNHRKLFLIDGTIAYTGSQNIVNPTYGSKALVWHDMTARLTGPLTTQLQQIFFEDWNFAGGDIPDDPAMFPAVEPRGATTIQAIPSGPNEPTQNLHRLILNAIHVARHRVVITTPYLVPDDSLLHALEVACLRGVQVDLVVPEKSDQPLTAACGRAYYADLARAGVNLHIHQDGLLHAKTITVDHELTLIGSSNFDIRSFYLNFELSLLCYGQALARELLTHQEQYIAESRPLDIAAWNRRPFAKRMLEDCAKLLSPLL